MVSKKKYMASKAVIGCILFMLIMIVMPVTCHAAKYKGIDYSAVYDYKYYKGRFKYVREHYKTSYPALRYFVKFGMKRRQRASEDFSVNSYIYGNKDLRRLYKNDYPKYYLHYVKIGCHDPERRKTATGIKKMTNYCTRWAGVDYSKAYDFNYYMKRYPELKEKFGVDDLSAFEHFMMYGIYKGEVASSKFDVKAYRKAHPELQKRYGYDYEKYLEYYVNVDTGKKTYAPTPTPKPTATPTPEPKKDISSSPKKKKLTETINGKPTIYNYLHNALVPCGRTLYIWGGGWGEHDNCLIGYQSSWGTFFKNNAKSGYDYTKHRFEYGKGLDCSGFAGWVLYNTIYKTNGLGWVQWHSSEVAEAYHDKGWCTLATDSKDQTYKPGDVVSMDGHVWISMGQCVDGTVVLIHSSPRGVQISGTGGRSTKYAEYYMEKYFPQWPYQVRTVSSAYLNYLGKARWKISSSSFMKDPEKMQKMSAEEVLMCLLGD